MPTDRSPSGSSRGVSLVPIRARARGKRIAYLSTYLPRECGLSTFTHDLAEAIDRLGVFAHPTVIAVHNPELYAGPYAQEVRFLLREREQESYVQAARYVNESDIALVCLQHEYGIFGTGSPAGTWDGAYILDFFRAVRKPVVTTIHTVLDRPNAGQRAALSEVGARSARVVVMAENVFDILQRVYRIPQGKLVFIPHGAPDVPFHTGEYFQRIFNLEDRDVLMTFGLLSPAKGIEYVLEALRTVVRRYSAIIYLIVGATHPVVRRAEGEAYRKFLRRRVREFRLADHVRFVNAYLTLNQLTLFLRATNIYLAPAVESVQYVSGTIAYAAAFGKAIISSRSRYAEYLLAEGRGLLVPPRDPRAIAEVLMEVLEHPQKKRDLEEAIYLFSRVMTWPNVASQYADLFRKVVAERTPTSRRA